MPITKNGLHNSFLENLFLRPTRTNQLCTSPNQHFYFTSNRKHVFDNGEEPIIDRDDDSRPTNMVDESNDQPVYAIMDTNAVGRPLIAFDVPADDPYVQCGVIPSFGRKFYYPFGIMALRIAKTRAIGELPNAPTLFQPVLSYFLEKEMEYDDVLKWLTTNQHGKQLDRANELNRNEIRRLSGLNDPVKMPTMDEWEDDDTCSVFSSAPEYRVFFDTPEALAVLTGDIRVIKNSEGVDDKVTSGHFEWARLAKWVMNHRAEYGDVQRLKDHGMTRLTEDAPPLMTHHMLHAFCRSNQAKTMKLRAMKKNKWWVEKKDVYVSKELHKILHYLPEGVELDGFQSISNLSEVLVVKTKTPPGDVLSDFEKQCEAESSMVEAFQNDAKRGMSLSELEVKHATLKEKSPMLFFRYAQEINDGETSSEESKQGTSSQGEVGDVDTETVQHDGDEMVAKSNETNDNENDDGTDLAQRKEVAMDAESNATNEEMMDEEKKDTTGVTDNKDGEVIEETMDEAKGATTVGPDDKGEEVTEQTTDETKEDKVDEKDDDRMMDDEAKGATTVGIDDKGEEVTEQTTDETKEDKVDEKEDDRMDAKEDDNKAAPLETTDVVTDLTRMVATTEVVATVAVDKTKVGKAETSFMVSWTELEVELTDRDCNF